MRGLRSLLLVRTLSLRWPKMSSTQEYSLPPAKIQKLDESPTISSTLNEAATLESGEKATTAKPERDVISTEVSSTSEQALNDLAAAPSPLPPLEQFSVEKVLLEDPSTKTIAVSGRFSGSTDTAVIVAEKSPLSSDSLVELFTAQTQLCTHFHNDIYSQIGASCGGSVGHLRLMTIYPASEAHVTKYSRGKRYIVQETPHIYASVTKPFIESQSLNHQWVFNILDGKAEQDRVIFSDPDPETGFVLAPDFKWDQRELQNLYLLAIVRRRDILSLRELRAEHLPLLKNMLSKGQEAIEKKYNIPGHQLRVYFHYQPSFYHLHVHFTYISYAAPKTSVGEAHLLHEVIDNIENIDPQYYQKKTLSFVVKDLTPLWKEYAKLVHV